MRFQVEKNSLVQMKRGESRSVVSDSLDPTDYSPWSSPGQNTRVGSCSLLQGIIKQGGHNTEVALMLKQPTEAKQNLSL